VRAVVCARVCAGVVTEGADLKLLTASALSLSRHAIIEIAARIRARASASYYPGGVDAALGICVAY
jgi:hypothetical protein